MKRRQLLSAAALSALILPGARLSFAATAHATNAKHAAPDARLVLFILRGAWDGLSVLVPHGDPDYAAIRGALALPATALAGTRLDDLFALHPKLSTLHRWWQEKSLLPLHAIATPYRERSHFDAQNLLEIGSEQPHAYSDGWLNRALQTDITRHAIALSSALPLVLQGTQQAETWAPERLPDLDAMLLDRLRDLYAPDAQFSAALEQALATEATAMDMGGGNRNGLRVLASAAGKFLAEGGQQIAVLESGGWDTHANQGSVDGALANRLADLDAALAALRVSLGDAWSRTAILLVSEFGRTVKPNGTRGTDHGTATAAFLAGGAVNGGRVLADWPGLSLAQLYQQRDLHPTQDLRALFKGVLAEHLRISAAALATTVFPGSGSVPALRDLLRV